MARVRHTSLAARSIYLVFVLPAVLSLALGGAVIGAILQEPDRSLDLTGAGGGGEAPLVSDRVAILGLSSSYGMSETITLGVAALDDSFDCGDLYVTISRAGDGEAIFQDGYFAQCYAEGGLPLPVEEGRYAKSFDIPGSYEITASLVSPRGTEAASVRGVFTVG